MSAQTEIFVFGLGAIGSFYAFILNEAPNTQVTVCGRSNYHVLKDHGMTFKSSLAKFGTKDNYRFHGVVRTPAEASSSKFDYVVCANKAITMDPPVSEQIAPVVSQNTTIIVIQNGIGNEEEFQARFPNNTVLSGVTWVGATQVEPGTIIHRDNNTMQFGCHFSKNIEKAQEQARLNKIVDIFRAGGTEIDVVPVIDVFRWKKTIWNGCWNTLTAITQCNTRELLAASPAGPIVARAIMEEMASIAHAQLGEAAAEINADFIEELLNRPSVKEGIYSSMCQDAKFSRPMEVEVIINGPLKKAKALGIKTPTLETISALISAMDWRFRNGVTGPP